MNAGMPPAIVTELLASFVEAKRRFYRDDLRPNAVEGGRFSEAVFRILEWATGDGWTPINKTLRSVDSLLNALANTDGNDSIRLHIPRTLRLIYDIRNKRDAAHLADNIDPNQQDASLVVACMDWVLAELVRLYHNVSAAEAHRIISDLVSKEVPILQVFQGFPRILKALKASDYCLVLLYWRGADGASMDELARWVRPSMRKNLRRTVSALDESNLVHLDKTRVYLTRSGELDVESRKLLEAA